MLKLESLLKTELPRCLHEVDATSISPFNPSSTAAMAFSLKSYSDTASEAQVLGYPLADYNPSCVDDSSFISPLHLKWSNGSEACVFDSQIHGYHGEMDASAKLRGSGLSQVFLCSDCGHTWFHISVQLDYWDACYDLLEDEPDLPIQDYFCRVVFVGECIQCGQVNTILDMDL